MASSGFYASILLQRVYTPMKNFIDSRLLEYLVNHFLSTLIATYQNLYILCLFNSRNAIQFSSTELLENDTELNVDLYLR